MSCYVERSRYHEVADVDPPRRHLLPPASRSVEPASLLGEPEGDLEIPPDDRPRRGQTPLPTCRPGSCAPLRIDQEKSRRLPSRPRDVRPRLSAACPRRGF